jgi:hypothetical protein
LHRHPPTCHRKIVNFIFLPRQSRSIRSSTFIYKSAALPLSFGQPVCATCLAADTTFFVRGAFFTGGGAAPLFRALFARWLTVPNSNWKRSDERCGDKILNVTKVYISI